MIQVPVYINVILFLCGGVRSRICANRDHRCMQVPAGSHCLCNLHMSDTNGTLFLIQRSLSLLSVEHPEG
jgi:hypothetical protein